jgi:peptide/nickel transport system substrate-binding protein
MGGSKPSGGVRRTTVRAAWRPAAAAAALALMLGPTASRAQELRVATAVDITSIDPHFANLDANSAMAMHIFSRLVERDARLRLRPGLAESWRLVDETTWEFRLRRGVAFHDGSPLTAEDVKASIERVAAVPNSPSPLAVYVRPITAVEVVDPWTVRLRTAQLFTQMPMFMSTIAIMSRRALEAVARPEHRGGKLLATTEQLNAEQGTIGSGPFRLVEWRRGQATVLERFPGYHGEAPAWGRVTIRPIANNAARTAALLAGDADLIDYVPISDIATLSRDPRVRLSESVTTRFIFIGLDRHRDAPPFVVDRAGNPLGRNPYNDLRVRQAMSRAINRPALVERVMQGRAVATGQFMPEGFPGHSPDLPVDRFDPEGARRLLAEAGYADGFGITLHTTAHRYPNDVQAAQAIAQMFARVGIATQVEAVPPSVYFPRLQALEYSSFLVGFGIVTGEPSSLLAFVLLTWDRERGRGAGNRTRYSNPRVDALYDEAMRTADPAAAEAKLREASEVAVRDLAVLPLFHLTHTWAMSAGFRYPGRTDEYTLAQDVRPAQ